MVRCAFPGCQRNTGKYLMSWLDKNRKKHWGLVCAMHDKIFGRQNLMRSTNMTLREAIAWETDNKEGGII